MNILDIMKLLAFNGISTSVMYDTDLKEYYLDLNTQAKSHLYLYEDGILRGRYKYENTIDFKQHYPEDILRDLCYEFRDSLHGRDFGNGNWFNLCDKLNIKYTI